MRLSKVFDAIIENSDKRYLIFYGGSSSTKTISILQYLTLYALKYPNKRIRLSAESIPVMKKGIIRDFKDVVAPEFYNSRSFNRTELTYSFPNGSVFDFVPGDEESRFKGPRVDIQYWDEINHIPQSVYDQAEIRTENKIISSFNPTARFWLADRFDDDNTYVNHSTVLDNPFVSQSIIDALKAKALKDPNFYKIYFKGEWGSLEGLIYKEGTNWTVIDELPEDYDKRVLAIDFGFSNDPTSILDIRYFRGELWVKELEYRTGLINSDIYNTLFNTCSKCRAVADSAEPKSIEEIHRLGIDIHPSVKGRGSINSGINTVKEFKMNITKDSVNTIKELRAYSWAQDKDGNNLNKPIDNWNHSLDALRYGVYDLFNRKIKIFI